MTCPSRPSSRRRLRPALLCFVVLAAAPASLLTPHDARAGELQKASEAVHGSSSSSSNNNSSNSSSSSSSSSSSDSSSSDSSSSSSDDGDGTSSSGSAWGLIAGYLFLAPFFIPNAAVEDHFTDRWSIAAHPYAYGAPGYFSHVGAAVEEDGETPRYAIAPESRKVVGIQLALEGMPPVGGLGRVQGGLRLVTAYRVELDAAYALYLDSSTPGADSAWIGKAHAAFRFAQGEHVQFRAGLGYRQWIDHTGSSLGVDGLYAFDIFWGRPMTTSVELSGGSLGSAWAAEARGTVGVTFGAGEVFAGYDALWIGTSDPRGPSAYLGGPVAGVRAYF